MGFQGKSISTASYDAGNRLTAWNRAGSNENHSQTWDYDDAGNWNSTTKDGDTEGRTHSVSNQITQLDGKAVSHDLKGNLTEYEYDRTDYRVKYDLDNRIVGVKADSETIRYRYDALGRRIVSKGDDETILIWWGDSECAEYEHRASQDAIQNDIMGHPTRLNSVIARDTAKRKRKVKLQWYHKNYLDHVYAVSDDNGNLVEHYRYTAFGEPEIYSATGTKRNTSAIGNTVMWNTRRYDADNGLYYYKYRHYAANIGRWLGRDPIEENGGVNLYAFVGNEPVGRWDRLGLEGWRERAIGSFNRWWWGNNGNDEEDKNACCKEDKGKIKDITLKITIEVATAEFVIQDPKSQISGAFGTLAGSILQATAEYHSSNTRTKTPFSERAKKFFKKPFDKLNKALGTISKVRGISTGMITDWSIASTAKCCDGTKWNEIKANNVGSKTPKPFGVAFPLIENGIISNAETLVKQCKK